MIIDPGPVYSIVTPFERDGGIAWLALGRYVDAICAQAPSAVYVMAYNSRFAQLSVDEVIGLNRFVATEVRRINPEIPVIAADPIACSTETSAYVAQRAAEDGSSLLSALFSEKFYSTAQLVDHFGVLGERAGIPLLIHQMPLISGLGGAQVNWPLDAVNAVMTLESVAAMKEDAKDDALTHAILKEFGSTRSIILSGGGKRQFLRHREVGAQNWLNGVGVWHPPLASRFWAAVEEGDQAVIDDVISNVEVPFFEGPVKSYGWHVACRAALSVMGWSETWERLPMPTPGSEVVTDVGRVIREMTFQQEPLLKS